MVSCSMQSLLDLRVMPMGKSQHQLIQQGLVFRCSLERQRKMAKAKDGGKKGGKGELFFLLL